MKPRSEMRRVMRQYGLPLQLQWDDQSADGLGLFQKVTAAAPEQDAPQQDKRGVLPPLYTLWAFDLQKAQAVQRVLCAGKEYSVVSGGYDSDVGCWRLCVQEVFE